MPAQPISRTVAGLAASAALMLAGCTSGNSSAGGDKAGGDAEPTVLTFADLSFSLDSVLAVKDFVGRVEDLSGGALRIDVIHDWENYAPGSQQQVVRDVADGKVDMAWAGTWAFDTIGVNSFRALNAPMLIDSYPLLDAVITSNIPGEMLKSLDDLGVVGIAVLADGLRKPVAVEKPLLSPNDYDGLRFTSIRSTTIADSIRALGAEPGEAIGPSRTGGLQDGTIDGYEQSLLQYSYNQNMWLSPYVTANVNLWANPLALIANPETLDRLSDRQREWIMEAGAAAAEHSTALVQHESDFVPDLCEAGARFATASDADLAAMRAAFEPVYTTLERDPDTADFIDRIRALKGYVDPGTAWQIPANCTGQAPQQQSTAEQAQSSSDDQAVLDGVYRWELTKEDAVATGASESMRPGELETFPWVFTVRLDDGIWTMTNDAADGKSEACLGERCTFSIAGDTIKFDWASEGYVLEFPFTTDGDGSLHLEPTSTLNAGDVFVWTTKPWQRIEDLSSGGSSDSASLDGTYRWELTADEAIAVGAPNVINQLDSFPWLFTVTLDDGVWRMTQDAADGKSEACLGDRCTYEIDGDHIVFTWDGAKFNFTFTTDQVGSLHLQPDGTMDRGDAFVWSSKPWDQIEDRSGDVSSDAGLLDGTYRWTLTGEDALNHGLPQDRTPEALATFPWMFTVTLNDGSWTMRNDSADGTSVDCGTDDDCTYTLEGDYIVFSQEGELLNFTFSVDADGTLHLAAQSSTSAGPAWVMATNPWERLD